jgi:lipopolysaccharide transport system ATP-binding protein
MSPPIIEVCEVSKRYQLGRIGFTSLRSEVERWWGRIRGSETSTASSEFWALRDVSFDVHPGEVMGVIGRNGAGKSTLLKILSEITEPTSGEIRLRGHVASLLEVGTGFHPELSGRENIYLNGATLGMKRAEIRRKFDEIVAFAEIEKFLETPVKRYSSGMYVRLAFAIAAHLEPEILLVDEVLAVGDHAFQQKCLGKMDEVAKKQGRTVLFVSHNMAAVARLCRSAVLLESGRVIATGSAQEIVERYLARAATVQSNWTRPADRPAEAKVSFKNGYVIDAEGNAATILPFSSSMALVLECVEADTTVPWALRVSIYDRQGHELFCTFDSEAAVSRVLRPGAVTRAVCRFPDRLLKPGIYSVAVAAHELSGGIPTHAYEEIEPMLAFEISVQGYHGQSSRGLLGAGGEWRSEWKL